MDSVLINGHKYDFEPGETILEVARRNDIDIPTLCYLKGATPTGACRMCLVEVKDARGPMASCSTPAGAGMEIYTETQRIVDARKLIIELLLISGNHNCAIRGVNPEQWTDYQQVVEEYDKADDICVAYGECKLQALAYKYGVYETKLNRIPTPYSLDDEDQLIGRDFSRCILCGRCVQACNDIQVNNAISYGYRGNLAKIVVKGDQTLALSDCVHCGECIDVCPVGALFEKKNRFDSRMWAVEHVRTTCHFCGVGCQLDLYIKDGKIVRVRGIEDSQPNQGRLCFRGRFAYDFIHSDERLTKPLIRKNDSLVEASWDEALDLIVSKLNEAKEKHGSDSIGCVVSTKNTNEDLFQTKKFFNSVLDSDKITHFELGGMIGIPYEDLAKAATIIVAGSDLTKVNPVAATFVKQAVKGGAKLFTIDCQETKIATFAEKSLNDLAELDQELDGEAILLHAPGYDITAAEKMANLKIHSINKENNTLGAYCLDIVPQADFDVAKLKFLYLTGATIEKRDNLDFLVVQNLFADQVTAMADVVLPAAVWVEYNGTYVSSDNRVNRVRKAVEPPGEAKPTWWIFRELARRMGHSWDSDDAHTIWEQEIILQYPHFSEVKYDSLQGDGVLISQQPETVIKAEVKIPAGIKRPNFHKFLCEQCADIKDIVARKFPESG